MGQVVKWKTGYHRTSRNPTAINKMKQTRIRDNRPREKWTMVRLVDEDKDEDRHDQHLSLGRPGGHLLYTLTLT